MTSEDRDSFVNFLKRKCIIKDGTWDIQKKINEGLITQTLDGKPIPPNIHNWYLISEFLSEWVRMNCSEQNQVY